MPNISTLPKAQPFQKRLLEMSERAISPNQRRKVKFQGTRPADLTDIPCYEFTPRDIEAIQPDSKTRFPKVVRPADLTDIPCYEFTPIDLGARIELTRGTACSNKTY